MSFACIYGPDFPVQAVVRNHDAIKQSVQEREQSESITSAAKAGVDTESLNAGLKACATQEPHSGSNQETYSFTQKPRSGSQKPDSYATQPHCTQNSNFSAVRVTSGLRGRLVAVLEGKPPMITVIAANERARKAGIEPGMTKMQAEACPDAVLLQRSLTEEESAHAALLDCAQAFSPRVESTAADTVIIDLHGLQKLFGPAEKIARALSRHAAEMGMETNVAVASNPDAAMHAARGFPGTTIIPRGKEAERLGSLPVEVLSPSPEILETLDRWGVHDLRALGALPTLALSERLGQEGLRLQALARGATSRTLVPAEPQLHFEESMELEDAVDLLEPLAFILSRLLEQLCMRLAARALSTNELRLKLELEVNEDVQVRQQSAFSTQHSAVEQWVFRKGKSDRAAESEKRDKDIHEHAIRLPVPMRDSKVFLKLLQLDLKSNPPAWPVKKITLSAEPAKPRSAQSGLFVPASPEPERLELTLARIRSVLQGADKKRGRAGAGISRTAEAMSTERVGSPVLLDKHTPDAFRMRHFSAAGERDERPNTSAASNALNALRIFRPPLSIKVELRDGAPARVLMNRSKSTADVVALAGPWRSSGEWWTDHAWSREEWDLAVRRGEHIVFYRAYRDVKSDEWFVEGSYD